MSKTTDWILEQEEAGKIYFDGEKYVREVDVQLTKFNPDVYEMFEMAEHELKVAFNNWQQLRNKINNKFI